MSPKTKKRLLITGLVLGGFLVVILITSGILLMISGAVLRESYRALEAEGRPTDPAALIPPPAADNENAAILYNSAFQLLNSEQVGHKEISAYMSDQWAKADKGAFTRADAEAYLADIDSWTIRTVIDIVRQAVAKPACRFDLNYNAGPGILMPHLAQMRMIARLFGTRGMAYALTDRPVEAWEDILLGLQMAEDLRDEPLLISQLVRNAMTMTMLRMAEKLCGQAALPADPAAIDRALVPLESMEPFTRAIDSERLLLGEWVFRKSGGELVGLQSEFGGGSELRLLFILPLRPWRQWDHAAYLDTLRAYCRIINTPVGDVPAMEAVKAMEQQVGRLSIFHVFTRMIVPVLGRSYLGHLKMIATVRICRTSLALLAFKAAHGVYPADLAALGDLGTSDPRIDPFSGRPLIFRVDENGCVLYSVGDDGKDDQGTPVPAGDRTGDYVWKLPR
ncbi:MAG: hypothetical protein ABIF71_00495 [Planctomycetota bacterium]